METEEEIKDSEMLTPPPLLDGNSDKDGDGDDDDDNDDDDSSSGSDDSKEESKEDAELALMKAVALKEEGNNYFIKEKDYEKASRSYRKGVNRIKNFNKVNSGDEQVKALLLTLQTNLSMMCFKLGKYRQSRDVATRALEIDPDHVKARYRHAVANRKMGYAEEAIMDLKLALSTDPSNATVRKEYTSLQKEIQRVKKNQKASLQKAFSKGGLLNDDRVEDEKAKAKRLAREKKEKEDALKKRKQKWEDDCVSLMAKGEEAISYEDWDKEELAKEEAEEEEAKRKREEDEKRRKAERKKAKAVKKAAKTEEEDGSDDDDDTFTEKELAAMRGYKKTADGRTTSYFTREQSAEEKAMLNIAPKQITDFTPQPITPSSSTGESGSAWNHAGTWYVSSRYSIL
jgi:tetratricopeptide (TPR) repeat protein